MYYRLQACWGWRPTETRAYSLHVSPKKNAAPFDLGELLSVLRRAKNSVPKPPSILQAKGRLVVFTLGGNPLIRFRPVSQAIEVSDIVEAFFGETAYEIDPFCY